MSDYSLVGVIDMPFMVKGVVASSFFTIVSDRPGDVVGGEVLVVVLAAVFVVVTVVVLVMVMFVVGAMVVNSTHSVPTSAVSDWTTVTGPGSFPVRMASFILYCCANDSSKLARFSGSLNAAAT